MGIQLIIKSPYQVVDDIRIDCDMSWSVGKIKEYLSNLYPGKPRKEDQKLIYCGRLLLDHLQLKDILNQEGAAPCRNSVELLNIKNAQSVHTMHVVCPFSVCLDGNAVQSTKTSSEATSLQNGNSADGVRQRTVASQSNAFANYIPMHPMYAVPQGNAAVSNPVTSQDPAYQMVTVQQMYAQMMAQYFTQAQGGIGNFQYMPFAPSPTAALPSQQPPASIPAAADIQDQPANGNALAYAQQERQPQNNAEDEAAAQDLLDWVYIMSRTMILLTILYFYSSLHRVLLVVSLGVLFFVYRAGVFEGRQRRTPSQTPANDQANETHAARGNDPEQNDGTAASQNPEHAREEEVATETEQVVSTEDDPATRVPESHISVQSVFSVAATFISTFFTSLIPEQPVPVNVN